MVNTVSVKRRNSINLDNIENIDISLDNFRKAFDREPTQDEIAMMMVLKARKQEKQINTSNTGNLMQRSKVSQELAIARANKALKDKVKCTPRGIQINKMLNYGLTAEQIMDVLQLTEVQVSATIERFKLPRPVTDLVFHQKVRN
jgi:DNA-binding CsgD family transcriptional regulator